VKRLRRALAIGVLTFLAGFIMNAQSPSQDNVELLAERAYIYAYPLVLLQATTAIMPPNHLVHVSVFPDASFRLIVRPNADTLYTNAWIDVSKEPMLLHVPDSGGRFYLLQFMDAWTETFADPGKRTTGTSEAWFAIAGPGWRGQFPPGVTRIDAPTRQVWLLGRTQTNGASDYDNVHAFQHGMRLVPLSRFPGQEPKTGSMTGAHQTPPGPTPPDRVKAMDAEQFLRAFADAMKMNPPHGEDAPMVRDLARIGIVPGQDFDPSKLSPEELVKVEAGVQAAINHLEAFVSTGAAHKTGWNSFQGELGRYGINYNARAITARVAIGANPPEDAVYISDSTDANGKPLSGAAKYRMHFAADQLPPVLAFWSITGYDKDGYFIANPINRYAIGDRDKLKFNPDGSLDLYIQAQSPESDHESNWLPSGEGPFNLTFRLYWPKPAILNGRWQPPAVELAP
jgi:hypothetical protein